MERIERSWINQISEVSLNQTQAVFSRWIRHLKLRIGHLFIHKGFLLLVIGFLLGRALILSKLTPFALPFFAAVYTMRRDKAGLAFVALMAGSLTLSFETTLFVFTAMFSFLVFYGLVKKFFSDSLKMIPFVVFCLSASTKLVITYFLLENKTMYEAVMAFVEAGLGFVLTLIFIQSIPLLTVRKHKQALRAEEVISLIILLASMLTGMIGWSFYGLSLEHIMSRYLVLLLAFVAGTTIGSTVGVVTGLILSLANVENLYEMSLLAFAGLLGGLLKEGRKIGVAFGLFIATLLIGLYGNGKADIVPTVMESCLAIVLFWCTPSSLTKKISKYIPGTVEYANEQQQYVRKIRDVTAQRVAQFSHVFQALANSFSTYGFSSEEYDEKEIDYFLSGVTEKTCQTCFKKEQCWSYHFDTTYGYMKRIMLEADNGDLVSNHKLLREWDRHCVKANKVVEMIEKEVALYQANKKLRKQVNESRKLVAEQLIGVSQVMEDFATEIQRERENHYLQEEQIFHALQEFGIEVGYVDIYSLEKGNIDIEMSIPYCEGHGECEKLIAPMLSDILGETIVVKREECAVYPNDYCRVAFGSTKTFTVDTGVAYAAKGGGLVSGDSYSMIELATGKYAIAISDGMGNGERAHSESNETLQLLQKILQTGIDESIAIKSINSILSLRTTDEIFSTLDLAMIDLQDASTKFLKIGSTPSFVKRGDKVIKIEASNLPMGILKEFEFEIVTEQLKAGDLLIMMSDGVFEGPSHVENHELWMKRKIKELQTNDPQEVADLIMEEVIRTRSGRIEDDMTVVVAKIKHNTPKWATIPAYMYAKKAQ
ncbi:stage II sporulation protein E [Thermaerobacillus caldiproteolyticus]|uniref:Stage II sporulation protein E n=1 Tax=Thermaerobacillus caldiproteolyticus TaxID=247480 RepID=A0A7V9Z9Z4_9BACL|nr:stage II sporulation protein E [Anoxybacillus caldiproteolyticus]MBA2876718.1 stage II sporulation protein E [Anoxybacillus caldiproteolyticus]QPA31011.1 stage II sporulation protein E [Anoxybacillus caldiproteolyticus]